MITLDRRDIVNGELSKNKECSKKGGRAEKCKHFKQKLMPVQVNDSNGDIHLVKQEESRSLMRNVILRYDDTKFSDELPADSSIDGMTIKKGMLWQQRDSLFSRFDS